MVALALLAQPFVELAAVRDAYGAGIYAIYYTGSHPLYAAISGTETPIYVGKADPKKPDASNPREQGIRLTARLREHASAIARTEIYAAKNIPHHWPRIKLADFKCRRLVCATNAQLVAEVHLIKMFWPLWNSETKACWGLSKHGDAAITRKNKRSPWDVVHPGREWALSPLLVNSLEPDIIEARIQATLVRVAPRDDHPALFEEMLATFRQDAHYQIDEPLVPPVGNVPGPDPDEVGDDRE